MPKLGDWTPSDAEPWLTEWDEDADVPHVMPGFGPKHKLSMRCWCHPLLEQGYGRPIVSHNVAH